MRIKNHSVWLISVLLLIGSILLFIGGPDYYSFRSSRHFWDLGHILYFALLTVLLSRWSVVSRMSLIRQWVTILALTLLIGVSIELIQYGGARTPDTGDVLRDMTGSLLVLVFGPLGMNLQPANRRRYLKVSMIVLMLALLWPLSKSLIDEAVARYQFPLLSGFETPFELDRWQGGKKLSVESISKGKLLKLSLTTEKYSGTSLGYFDGDWTSARSLKISFYNPDKNALPLTLRIHDFQHTRGYQEYADRYNRRFLLLPGWNKVEIDLDEVEGSPSNRNMDMSRIYRLGFFTVSLPEPRIIYIDEVRLSY